MSTAPPISPRAWAIGLPDSSASRRAISSSRGFDEVGGLEQDAGALAAFMRGQGPFSNALCAAFTASVDVLLTGLRIARHDEAVARAAALQRTAVSGFDMLAVDEELVGLRVGGGFCWHGDIERGVH